MKVDKKKQKQLRTWNSFRIVRVQHFVATARLKKGADRHRLMLQSSIATSFACLSFAARKHIETAGLVYTPKYIAKVSSKIQKYFGTDIAKIVMETDMFLSSLEEDKYKTAESCSIDAKSIGVVALATNLSLDLADPNVTSEDKEFAVAYTKWAIQYTEYAMGEIKRIVEKICEQYEKNEKILISI